MAGLFANAINRRRQLKHIARRLQHADRHGKTFIAVDYTLVPKVRKYIWELEVERANEKWASVAQAVTLQDWHDATKRAEPRLGSDKIPPF